jgi:nucleotide-binding universal stress UspA family protein
MKILLAVDGSDYTRKMIEYVCTNQGLFDTSHEFVLLNVPVPVPPHAKAAVGSGTVDDYYRDEAQKVLEPSAAALQARGITARREWRAGHAGETIGRFAAEGGFDMLIMGSHGHGALARLVMGSVTSEVLAECRTPLLLIR